MNAERHTVVYEPNRHLKQGIRIWKEMGAELFESRELVWRLFVRNLMARYKQTALGYVWIVLTPAVAIGTFMVLHRAGVFQVGELSMPYPLFALMGLTVWQLFATGLSCGCQSLVGAGDMIAKINFPRETLVFAAMAQALFEFAVKYGLILLGCWLWGWRPSWGIVLFPLAALPLFVLTVGLSLMLALLNGVIRDTANAVALITTFLMFLTPVFYPVPPEKGWVFQLNPLTPLVEAPRRLAVTGTLGDGAGFVSASGLAVLVFLLAWRVFHLVETKIPERM